MCLCKEAYKQRNINHLLPDWDLIAQEILSYLMNFDNAELASSHCLIK